MSEFMWADRRWIELFEVGVIWIFGEKFTVECVLVVIEIVVVGVKICF